jgi:hypothetical protein
MNRLYFLFPLLSLPLFLSSCTSSNANMEVNGIPAFVAGGAEISEEPEPLRPDPAIMHFEEESGPVELKIITDKRRYPNPPKKKKKKVEEPIEYERGRDYRIRRLF